MNDRLPPHSQEAESEFIGCLLNGEADTLNAAMGEARAEMFFDLRNQSIFAAVERMMAAGIPVCVATVRQHLADKGQLESVGGLLHLNACVDSCPSPSLWFHYLETIREKATLRKLAAVCAGIGAKIHDAPDTNALVDQAEREILAVRGRDVKGETSMKDYVLAVTSAMEADLDGSALRGLSTGFRILDQWTRGLKPQNLIVIAARPAVGKSALGMQIAARVALEEKLPVAVFSLEMSGEEITERAIKQRARVTRRHALQDGEVRSIVAAGAELARAPLFILDEGGISIGQIQARARRLHQRHHLALIVVDYLQLVRGSGRKENRAVEVGEVSMGLKALAKELNVPVVVLAQLNRDCEKDGRPPRMSDLRESGSIEADADIVILLHTKEDEGDTRAVELKVAKNRGNRCGKLDLTFNGPLTEFREADPIEPQGKPRRSYDHD